MGDYGAQYPPPNQPLSGPPVYGGPYPQQPVSGPVYPVSGPQYPTSGGALVPVVPEQPLCQIGEIMVTNTTVHTPVGGCPLRGSQWTAHDQWITTQRTPVWAIVLAIVGFCLLAFFSLLFLLAKETVLNGVVQVTVTNGPFTYVARVPVFDHMAAQHVHNQVNYVRALAMR